jgi:hypothetical protein
MRRLIAVWFVTPRREVLLKPKKEEIEPIAPP